jgi:hypothetical protein
LDANGKLTTQLYDDLNFIIVKPYLCNNIPSSPAYGIDISQPIRYTRACSTYDQFLIGDRLLTNKLMSQEFLMSCLQAAFRRYDGYDDLVGQYNLSSGQMLSDVFHITFLTH